MKKKVEQSDQILTTAPKEREFGVATDVNTKNPLDSQQYYPGDSVNEHKNIEDVNLYMDEGEISQQNNNL